MIVYNKMNLEDIVVKKEYARGGDCSSVLIVGLNLNRLVWMGLSKMRLNHNRRGGEP